MASFPPFKHRKSFVSRKNEVAAIRIRFPYKLPLLRLSSRFLAGDSGTLFEGENIAGFKQGEVFSPWRFHHGPVCSHHSQSDGPDVHAGLLLPSERQPQPREYVRHHGRCLHHVQRRGRFPLHDIRLPGDVRLRAFQPS